MQGPGEHSFGAGDPVGGEILAAWHAAAVAGDSWEEYLCLEPHGDGRWRLVIASMGPGSPPALVQHDDERCWVAGLGDLDDALDVLSAEGCRECEEWELVTLRLAVLLA